MKNFKNKKSGFTLIELVIVVAILAMLMTMSYAPYMYYQDKLRVKMASKDIGQVLYNYRNLSIHWVDTWSWNLSVWILFDKSDSEKEHIKILTYPYSFSGSQITVTPGSDIKLYKTIKLQKKVWIDDISWKDKVLFFFQAITGEPKIYSIEWAWKTEITDEKIKINISLKGSNTLKKTVEYAKTNKIVDYK